MRVFQTKWFRRLARREGIAAHASIRMAQLYYRRNKAVKMDDVVLLNLRSKS